VVQTDKSRDEPERARSRLRPSYGCQAFQAGGIPWQPALPLTNEPFNEPYYICNEHVPEVSVNTQGYWRGTIREPVMRLRMPSWAA
jgi:hypothetical protein